MRNQLACSLTNLFNAYAGVRTFSNSLEMAITAAALASWPWDGIGSEAPWGPLATSLSLAALAVIVRPAALLLWAVLGVGLLARTTGEAKIDILALTSVIG